MSGWSRAVATDVASKTLAFTSVEKVGQLIEYVLDSADPALDANALRNIP